MVVMNTTVTMANITELYPGVTYNFTVTAFNEVGNSSFSAVFPSRTLEEGKSEYQNTCMNVPPVVYVTCLSFSSSFKFSPECECVS